MWILHNTLHLSVSVRFQQARNTASLEKTYPGCPHFLPLEDHAAPSSPPSSPGGRAFAQFNHQPLKVAQMAKNPPAMQETQGRSLGWEDPLKKGMATHSSILAWRIPWTEETGVQSMGSQRVGHD